MSLALLGIITALVLVLQIIILVLIAGTRKSIAGLKTAPQPAQPAIERDRPPRRDNDFRRNDRRPFNDQKQRPQQQPQSQQQAPAGASQAPAEEGIEKSLRDINLRLKNAERDQEFARRRMQENLSRDPQRNRDDRNRDRNRPHGGRDRNDRHGNRDHRRGNWHDRQMSPAPQGPAAPLSAEPTPASEPLFEAKAPVVLEPMISAPAQEAPVVANDQDQSSADYGSEEGLQHGRKIIVKRRPLSTEESSGESLQNNSDAASPVQAMPSGPEEETSFSGPDASAAEIKFGRR
jgi:hypothetical protein